MRRIIGAAALRWVRRRWSHGPAELTDGRYSPVPMPDYDAIVIGAGHNGLTAAAVMARGGLRVLCLEKNHFIGGMASTTELIRGYRFELAGSIQFPVPNEIFEDLDLGSCPDLRARGAVGQHRRRRPAADLPLLRSGAPARAPGRDARDRGRPRDGGGGGVGGGAGAGHRPLRRAPAAAIARRDVGLRHQRGGAGGDPHGDVRQRAWTSSTATCPTARSTRRSAACSASWPSTPPSGGRTSPGSALCLAFALASPGTATMSKVRGGLGTMADHLLALFEHHGGELRRHTKVVAHRGRRRGGPRRRARRRRGGHRAGRRVEPRPDGHLHPAARPRGAARRVRAARGGHRPSGRLLPGAFRPATGCPSTARPTKS